MVHHYDSEDRATQPIVDVYCGGELEGSYGAPPDPVTTFDEGGGNGEGDMWKVTDILAEVDGSGTTTGCRLRPVRPPEGSSGYYVPTGDTSY